MALVLTTPYDSLGPNNELPAVFAIAYPPGGTSLNQGVPAKSKK